MVVTATDWQGGGMSFPGRYPEPVYAGDGEASAFLHGAGTAPDLGTPPGNHVDYLARGTDTAGAFGLYRWNMGPEPSGPGPHFHRTISESFYVLSGRVRIYDGEQWRDTSSGDFVHVPPGGIHGFRNESGEPASMLLLFTPGAPREHYFETLFAGGTKDMSEEEKAAFYAHHDNIWV